MKQPKPDPVETFVVATEALARIRALEMNLFVLAEHLTGRSVEESEQRHEQLVNKARERLLERLGHERLAFLAMLRGMGIDPPAAEEK